jgi:hypothetical protein
VRIDGLEVRDLSAFHVMFDRLRISFSEPSINSQGTVAFSGGPDTFTTGIFAGNGDALAVLIGAGGPLGFFGQPSINDSGTVAFEAFARGRGVFTGPDPVADKVIAFGDTLLGSTVSDVRLSPRGLNNSGEIAFYAELADGTQGIFRATPVPEPGSPLLLGRVLAGLVAWRPRKKRSVAFQPSGDFLAPRKNYRCPVRRGSRRSASV